MSRLCGINLGFYSVKKPLWTEKYLLKCVVALYANRFSTFLIKIAHSNTVT